MTDHPVTNTPRRLFSRWSCSVLLSLAAFGAQAADQINISGGGTPSYSFGIAVPPGIAGMSPNIGLLYSASTVNGPVGLGWAIQGISMITRCAGNRRIDSLARAVDYGIDDKLCLDGQRLIQTNAVGSEAGIAQQNDSLGGAGFVREYRTEKDMYARIRAYGTFAGDPANGPAYFKVWTKSGQIYEYGVNSNTTANAQITAQGKNVIVAWPVSRIADTLGNYMDFQYEQRDVATGSGIVANTPMAGREWNLLEIRYTGNGAQLPTSKVVFSYSDRAAGPDRAETYHAGSKNVSIRLLNSVRTYINWPAGQVAQPAGAVKVKTIKLTYDTGPISQRSRVKQITECAGAAEAQCLPATTFNYADGGDSNYSVNAAFKDGPLSLLPMQNATGTYGMLQGNFFGSGRTDILRWGDNPMDNVLYKNDGEGVFSVASGFNLKDQNLFKNNGCFTSTAADFNGDGLTDILRTMSATSSSGVSCGTIRNVLYLSNGDGSFRATEITGIDFTKRQSIKEEHYDCLQPRSKTYIKNCSEPGDTFLGSMRTLGRTFHVLDVNNDGLLDIVTTIAPFYGQNINPPSDAVLCAGIECTKVYLGQANGGFVETTSNLLHLSVYADPKGNSYELYKRPYLADINGDGATDFLVDSGVWLSRGDGNFDTSAATQGAVSCGSPMDFNGDGRTDCLMPYSLSSSYPTRLMISDGTFTPKEAKNFATTPPGQQLYENAWVSGSYAQTVGTQFADIDGDGRSDIVRWKDDAGQNAIFLSNGDGTFRQDSTFNLTSPNDQLQKSDGSASFMLGDFTGRGNTEILRLRTTLSGESNANRNLLYVKTNSTPPDQLQSVVSSTGIKTTLSWVTLTNEASGRYTSDRKNPALAAVYPIADVVMPSYVVATTTTDSGVGNIPVLTQFSYAGLKVASDGRGWLGFRETRRQSAAANGAPITVVTQYLQDSYTGMARWSETYLGSIDDVSKAVGQLLSRSTYAYCDKTAAATTSTSTSPCATNAKVQRPYLYQSVEEGKDLTGAPLPVVTTTNSFNNSGDPVSIVVKTEGDALGIHQSFVKTSVNDYKADNIAGDNWILGRLQKATVQNDVPNSLPGIATQAYFPPPAPIPPTPEQLRVAKLVMPIIISLLLD